MDNQARVEAQNDTLVQMHDWLHLASSQVGTFVSLIGRTSTQLLHISTFFFCLSKSNLTKSALSAFRIPRFK